MRDRLAVAGFLEDGAEVKGMQAVVEVVLDELEEVSVLLVFQDELGNTSWFISRWLTEDLLAAASVSFLTTAPPASSGDTLGIQMLNREILIALTALNRGRTTSEVKVSSGKSLCWSYLFYL